MEKIAKALDKARQRRESGRSFASPERYETAPRVESNPVSPRYRDTRVVGIDTSSISDRRVVAGFGSHEIADSFRILRTRVIQQLAQTGGTTLAVTSAQMSEGKTVVGANLAISLSQYANHTVLLADLDLRRSSVHKLFGIGAQPGLSDYLLRDTPLSECLVNPSMERLVILPSGAPLRRSSETLSSKRMSALADELKNRYPDRIVLYDMPPLLPTDDTLVFLKHVDASLLVVEEGRTSRSDIERSLELLEDHNLIGTVLNKARSNQWQYAYY